MPSLEDVIKIIYNDKFQTLSAHLSEFDPFRVLRIDKYEIRHANTLAWLLDSNGNHSLEDTFFRTFVARLIPNQDGQKLANLVELAVDPTILVRREVRLKALQNAMAASVPLSYEAESDEQAEQDKKVINSSKDGAIDILVEGADWVLVIEAKLYSGEGVNQLIRYREALDQYAKNKKCFYLYLTIDGDELKPPRKTGPV